MQPGLKNTDLYYKIQTALRPGLDSLPHSLICCSQTPTLQTPCTWNFPKHGQKIASYDFANVGPFWKNPDLIHSLHFHCPHKDPYATQALLLCLANASFRTQPKIKASGNTPLRVCSCALSPCTLGLSNVCFQILYTALCVAGMQ